MLIADYFLSQCHLSHFDPDHDLYWRWCIQSAQLNSNIVTRKFGLSSNKQHKWPHEILRSWLAAYSVSQMTAGWCHGRPLWAVFVRLPPVVIDFITRLGNSTGVVILGGPWYEKTLFLCRKIVLQQKELRLWFQDTKEILSGGWWGCGNTPGIHSGANNSPFLSESWK